MEVVSIETGRTTWLFPTEEILPLGGTDPIAIIQKLAERYDFKNFPEKPTREEVDKNGLKFGTGIFNSDGKRAIITEFALYTDGVVAIANTTEHSSAFLDDLMDYLIREFQFRRPISPVKKVYVSLLTVEFEQAVSAMFADHAALLSLIGGYLNAPLGTRHGVEVTRIDFALNDSSAPTSAGPRFILEARASVPLARKRYFSNAAMHTQEHLKLLSAIEKMFAHREGEPHV
ncbi:hypothetical protein [Bradyrhizobium sp. B039]|uniref:hypothetical protein n=1 Tax=Bradyrhizobium sp. B039 TaxID=3140239 RepID=UPI0031832E68